MPQAVTPHQLAHVEIVVGRADERVAEVVTLPQRGERGEHALYPFVGRDESERRYLDGAAVVSTTRRDLARRGGWRDVVVDLRDGRAGRDLPKTRGAAARVREDALGGAREPAVEREEERARGVRGE